MFLLQFRPGSGTPPEEMDFRETATDEEAEAVSDVGLAPPPMGTQKRFLDVPFVQSVVHTDGR
jgi:hypothetical protein